MPPRPKRIARHYNSADLGEAPDGSQKVIPFANPSHTIEVEVHNTSPSVDLRVYLHGIAYGYKTLEPGEWRIYDVTIEGVHLEGVGATCPFEVVVISES